MDRQDINGMTVKWLMDRSHCIITEGELRCNQISNSGNKRSIGALWGGGGRGWVVRKWSMSSSNAITMQKAWICGLPSFRELIQ